MFLKKFKWNKICSNCGETQYYKKKWSLQDAISKNTRCNKCRGKERKIKIPENGWIRTCPICGIVLQYIDKAHLYIAIKRNGSCRKCGIKRKYKEILNDHKRKCNCCNKMLTYSSRRNLIRAIKRDGVCFDCNLKIKRNKSEKMKEKLRNIVIEKIKEMGSISYNPIACRFIDKLNKERGWNLQHAENGGEIVVCGYSLDGYDKEKNIIFEYDELYHSRSNQKIKDIKRQNRLIEIIHPSMFIRYNQRNNELYDIINNTYISI